MSGELAPLTHDEAERLNDDIRDIIRGLLAQGFTQADVDHFIQSVVSER